MIIVGHTRCKAAQKLGLEEVPVHVATDLTPEQIKAYRIADNQTATLAEWDYELLPIELSALQELDFDLDLLGFSEDELAKSLDPDVKEGLCDPDDVPEPPDEAITQPGDLWILGDHRLLCGDSSKPEDVDRLLDGATIHLVNTDPPYNVKVEPRSNNAIAAGLSSFAGSRSIIRHWTWPGIRRNPNRPTRRCGPRTGRWPMTLLPTRRSIDVARAWFGNMARVLEPGRGFYIWGGYANCGNYPPVLKAQDVLRPGDHLGQRASGVDPQGQDG